MTLKTGSVDYSDIPEPIGMHNPKCEGDFISDCVDDEEYKECTHAEDVYIICDGAKTEVPDPLSK